jgi:sporulation protein YlmC with PRC-barrel domain
MKTQNRKIASWMAALVCLTLAPGTKAGDDTDAPKPAAAQESSTETTASEGAPTKVNKASGILGMDVRNQNDEHLGHIKDVVFDWKTEKVSYAVISTGTKALLDINEKLLAVPLTALTASADQKHLILNADKSKVETAMGFDKNNWPSVSSPSWGAEPVWQKETDKPAVTEPPAKDTDAAVPADAVPETKPDVKPDQDQESKPDIEHESEPDMDQESDEDAVPDMA